MQMKQTQSSFSTPEKRRKKLNSFSHVQKSEQTSNSTLSQNKKTMQSKLSNHWQVPMNRFDNYYIPSSQDIKKSRYLTESPSYSLDNGESSTKESPYELELESNQPKKLLVQFLSDEYKNEISKIETNSKDISKKMIDIETKVMELEENCCVAQQLIANGYEEMIRDLELHKEQLLGKVRRYTDQKKQILIKEYNGLQNNYKNVEHTLQSIEQYIYSTIDNNEKQKKLQQLLKLTHIQQNEKTLDTFNTSINIQFANKQNDMSSIIQIVDRLLSTEQNIIEPIIICLKDIFIKKSEGSDNKIVRVKWEVKANKQWDSYRYYSCQLEMTPCNQSDDNTTNINSKWSLIKEVSYTSSITSDTIEIIDGEQDLFKWGKFYKLRVRIYCILEHAFSPYSEIIILKMNKSFSDSNILRNKEKDILLSFLPKTDENQVQLLYRGSRDGFYAKSFHTRCNKQKQTLTIILSEHNNVFGGFTNLEWKSRSNNGTSGLGETDNGAFLYLLRSMKGDPPQKFLLNCEHTNHAIKYCSKAGPVFGSGYDLYIGNNCDITNASYCTPKSYIGLTDDILAGSQTFKVKEIEVYSLN